MQAGDVVLGHLLQESRSVGDDAFRAEMRSSLAHAASQLGVLSSGAQQPLVSELCTKARGLLNSKQAAARQLGLDLLAGTIADCDRRTFLQSQLDWFSAALGLLRSEQPAGVQAGAWACLAVLFDRLGRMLDIPGVRRDGASMVPKLVALLQQRYGSQQQQQQQQHGSTEVGAPAAAPEPAALQAVLAAATALPAPFRQHLKFLEPLLSGALTRPGLSPGPAMRLAASCVAALPRINGDGSSWSAMAQRLLASAHALLDTLLLGMEDQGLAATARELQDPQAVPLPRLPSPASTSLPAYRAAFGQLEAVAEALQALLTRSYPSPVPLPSMGLLLLVSRILGVDDASGGPGKAGSAKFAELCVRLPGVHALALRLLCTLLRTAGAQLAPLYLTTARLLAEYLGRVASGGAGALTPTSPMVRGQLYAATRALLQSAGVGVVRPLAPAVLQCARAELYGSGRGARASSGSGGAGAGEQPPKKKAKKRQGQAAAEAEEDLGGPATDDAGAQSARLGLSAQAGMLGVLEALLTSGAALLAPGDRAQADAMAAHIAATSTAAVQKLSQEADGDAAPLAPLQLAAYRALLAAVLAPAEHRPPFLPLALRLFRGGLRGGSPALAAWCPQALLSCEALLHPRAVPHPPSLRPLGAPAATGAFGLPAAGEAFGDESGGSALGKPAFWSYLDVSAEGATLLQASQLQQQQQQQQQQQRGEGGKTAMTTASPLPAPRQEEQQEGCQPEAFGLVQRLQALQDRQAQQERQQAQQQAEAAALLARLQALQERQAQQGQQQSSREEVAVVDVVMAEAPPAQQAQQAQQPAPQGLSSMAAMMLGGASSSAALHAAAAAAPAPAPLAPMPAPPAQEGPTGAGLRPPISQQAPAAALGRPMALLGGEDSDSDGPLPEIDSGDEEGSSSDEEQ